MVSSQQATVLVVEDERELADTYADWVSTVCGEVLTAYTATTNQLNLPPEYETALKFAVAVDWAPELSVKPSEVVVARAMDAIRNLRVLHSQPVTQIDTRPFRDGGRDYDINGDVHY